MQIRTTILVGRASPAFLIMKSRAAQEEFPEFAFFPSSSLFFLLSLLLLFYRRGGMILFLLLLSTHARKVYLISKPVSSFF